MKTLTPILGKLHVLSVFTACFAWGQATNSAEVTGSLTDPSGAIVPGVAVTVRDPNVVGDPTAVSGGQNIYSWFNVKAFGTPTPGTFGNMGRNIVYGPGLTANNVALHKSYKFTERFNLDISANAANIIKHPSFALPDKLIGAGRIGRITATSVGSRQMELVAKFRF
jgi:hypothetical protein